MQNIIITVLQKLQILYTHFYLTQLTEKFGDGQSLSDLQGILANYKVDSLAVQIGMSELPEIPLPSIVLLKEKNEYLLIDEVQENQVVLYDEKNQVKKQSLEEFEKNWTGYALLLQKNDSSKEFNYEKHFKVQKKQKRLDTFKNVVQAITIISGLILLGLSLKNIEEKVSYGGFYVLHVIGFGVSAILLSGEVFKDNEIFKKACNALGSSSCDETIKTDKKLPFEWLSWSEIGVFYFVGSLLLLAIGQNTSYLLIQSVFAGLGMIGVIWSLYYQKFVQKKWCMLCLSVMGVLVLESIVSIYTFTKVDIASTIQTTDYSVFNILIFSYAFPVLLWFLLKPYLNTLQEKKNENKSLRKFKYNYDNFKTLLHAQHHLESVDYPQDFIAGNGDSPISVLMVSRPTCPPCVRAKGVVEELVSNFGDYFHLTTLHLASSPTSTDYTQIMEIMPSDYSQQEKERAISNHFAWVSHHQINHTPAYFINGYLLPEQYDISELKYFLVQMSNEQEEESEELAHV